MKPTTDSNKEPALHVPEGWTLKAETRLGDISTLTSPKHVFATIDFTHRGFRGGMFVTSGAFVGEIRTRSGYDRKAYVGRGWQQQLVDDAVAWLGAV